MKASFVMLLLLQLVFAVAVYSQENTFEQVTFSAGDIIKEKEEVEVAKEIENANVLESSFQIVRPHYDKYSKEKVLQINTPAMKALEKYFAENNEDIFVVGVVGGVHCGKSYLLNELLGDNTRFKVGKSVNPETQGIWVSIHPNNAGANGKTVVALDTEGFFSPESNDDYDAKLFAITSLLSSSLVYNTIKNIDQSQVDYLEVLARKMHLFSLKQSSEDNLSFPHFYWIIRDFIYSNNNKNQMQTKWLNDQLTNRNRGTSLKESYEDNTKTNMLSEIFTNVDCLTLPIPESSRAALQNLGSRKNTNKAWVSALNDVRAKILATKNRRVSNGLEFLKAMKALVKSIQQVNNFPEVPSVWEALLSAQNETAIKEAEDVFDLIMNKRMNATNPLTEEEFETLYNETTTTSLKVLRKYLFDVKSLYVQCSGKLRVILLSKRAALLKRNNNNLKEFCKYAKLDAYTKVSQGISKIQLPMTRDKLIEKMGDSEDILSRREYDKFNDICMGYVEDLRGEVEELKRTKLESNSQKIMQYLSTIAEKSIHTYNTMFDDEIKKTFSIKNAGSFLSTEFNAIDARLSDEAIRHFSRNAKEYSSETEYDATLIRIKSDTELLKEGKMNEIKGSIERSIRDVFDEVYMHFKKLADELSLDLPLTDAELENKFFNIRDTCQKEVSDKLSAAIDGNGDSFYMEKVNSEKEIFSTKAKNYWNRYVVVENNSQYQAHVAEPFRKGVKSVQEKCIIHKTKLEFESCARDIVKTKLEHIFKSEELTEKAIDDFLARQEIRNMCPEDIDFTIITTFIIGAVVILFLVFIMRS